MQDRFTVVVSAPDVDAAVASALVGRSTPGHAESLVFESERLADFFERSVQQKLPHNYDLVFCGLEVVHTDWDGRTVRPRLMDALRRHIGPVQWFAAGRWEPEDRGAVEQLIGRENVFVAEQAASTAALVAAQRGLTKDPYASELSRAADEIATGRAAVVRRILTALKGEHRELSVAIALLMEERVEDLIEAHGAASDRIEAENRRLARERAAEPLRMGEMKLVCLSLPPGKHAHWAEISAYAREEAEAELALCRLEGRQVMLLCRGREPRVDLQAWARYVTDLLPQARSVGARADVVPLIVEGLNERAAAWTDEVLGLLLEGAHLLKG